MRILIVLFMTILLSVKHSYSNTINDTFQVDKQSFGYGLGWNLSWAENCNYSGYYNKFWKLYKKILATNDPRFEGIEVGWKQSQQADESVGCSEATLKQILNDTENLLNNPHNEKSLNTGSTNALSYKTAAELCFDIENNRGTQWEKRFQNEANKRNINCEEVTNSAEEICLYAYNKITDNWSTLSSARKYVEKAKKLGISCKPKDQENLKNESYANNSNIAGKYNNFSKSQLTEIISDFPKPPVFDEKVKTRFGDFKYNKLDTFQKWNWIFEYSNYCQSDKFKEIYIYLVKNKFQNKLIDLVVNSENFSITNVNESDFTLGAYSHYLTFCNNESLDIYLESLNNLVIFFKNYKMNSPKDNNLHLIIKLDCRITNYNISNFSRSWVESIVPKTYSIKLNNKKGNVGINRIHNIKYLNNKITFEYIIKNDYNINLIIKNIFFTKSKKLNISFNIPDSQWLGDTSPANTRETTNIWGDCTKDSKQVLTIINTKTKKKEQVSTIDNFSSNKIQIKENVIKNTNKITPKTKEAEDKCTEIGFKKGTEKYGVCVLKMLELK